MQLLVNDKLCHYIEQTGLNLILYLYSVQLHSFYSQLCVQINIHSQTSSAFVLPKAVWIFAGIESVCRC